jgi:DNA-binding NarL/FixJ family response regulator
MPVMDGPHFLAQLRRHPAFRTLPVVAMTTSTDVNMIRRAYDFGANAVVNKVDSFDRMSPIIAPSWDSRSRLPGATTSTETLSLPAA